MDEENKAQRYYRKRKEAGRCARCGAPVDAGMVNCEACLQKLREHRTTRACKDRRNETSRNRYAIRRRQGLCALCGKNPAEEGMALCAACNEKRRAISRARYAAMSGDRKQEYLGKSNAYGKERARMLKELGLCVTCGKEKAEPGHVQCTDCRLYRNQMRHGYTGRAPRRMKGKRTRNVCDAFVN